MKNEDLKGKAVTIAYSIENHEEFMRSNPLLYKHHGLEAFAVSTQDLFEEVERLQNILNENGIDYSPGRFQTAHRQG